MLLKDFADGEELTLLEKPSPTTDHSVYLNKNICNQLLETGQATWGGTKVTTEQVVFYGREAFVLRIKHQEHNWVLILPVEVIPEFKDYLRS
jgi:hypothetical protein